MNKCICPYFNYVIEQIDKSYIEVHPEIPRLGFLIYPLGSYWVCNINDLCEFTSYLLNHIFTCSFTMSTLDQYNKKLLDTKASTKSITITNEIADYSEITNGKYIIESLNHIISNCEEFPLLNIALEKFKNQSINEIDNFMISISAETLVQRDSYNKYNPISFESIFTILWNYLILFNSMSDGVEIKKLDCSNVDIVSIINKCWELYPVTHTPIIDLQKSSELKDFNSLVEPYNSADIDQALTKSSEKYEMINSLSSHSNKATKYRQIQPNMV